MQSLDRRQARASRRPLVIGDGHLGIWGALAAVFPEAKEQRKRGVGSRPRARLGANGGVLPVPARALEASADLEHGGVENATAVTWKTLLIAEKTFRRLDVPELLADVARRGRVRQLSTCDEPRARRRTS